MKEYRKRPMRKRCLCFKRCIMPSQYNQRKHLGHATPECMTRSNFAVVCTVCNDHYMRESQARCWWCMTKAARQAGDAKRIAEGRPWPAQKRKVVAAAATDSSAAAAEEATDSSAAAAEEAAWGCCDSEEDSEIEWDYEYVLRDPGMLDGCYGRTPVCCWCSMPLDKVHTCR
jgi:hypothetical protein